MLLSIENQSCFSIFSCKITRRITSRTASFFGRQKHRIRVCCITIYLALQFLFPILNILTVFAYFYRILPFPATISEPIAQKCSPRRVMKTHFALVCEGFFEAKSRPSWKSWHKTMAGRNRSHWMLNMNLKRDPAPCCGWRQFITWAPDVEKSVSRDAAVCSRLWHVAERRLIRQCIRCTHAHTHVRLKHARTCCQLALTLKPSESKSHSVALGDVQPLPGNNSLHLGDWVVK